MSDGLVNLLAALLGALVGGTASLAGSVVVNRLELRRATRLRLYDQAIPELIKAVERYDRDEFTLEDETDAEAKLEVVRRLSALAGPTERKLADDISDSGLFVLSSPEELGFRKASQNARKTIVQLRLLSNFLKEKLD